MKTPQPPLPTLRQGVELIDTHCHLDMEAFQPDLETVISSARLAGVCTIITIGIDLASSQRACAIADQHPGIYATIGFHPHDALQVSPASLRHLQTLRDNRAVVGFGEIGLDYAKQYAPRSNQVKAFTEQLHLARDLDLPVVIHDRDAHEDIYAILRSVGSLPRGGVMHCFSGDQELAGKMLDLGLLISIPGVVTFANARSLQAVVQAIDIDHLLLETDGPFLAPVPYRGKRNEPKLLLYTAQMVAQLKGISINEVAQKTSANAQRLFNLPSFVSP